MLIQKLFDESGRQYYLFVIVTVVISIVLHELAHGWMAMRLGDDTPLHTGHMTGNPLVHMGPFSLIAAFLFGIAWGQMPIDPTRLRGRYGALKVAAAGPATNLALALVAVTALGLWWRFGTIENVQLQHNLARFIWVFGLYNAMLCVFNLIPVPPLDGSHILANCHRGYADLLSDPTKQGLWFFAFMGAFMMSSVLFVGVGIVVLAYVTVLGGNIDYQILNF